MLLCKTCVHNRYYITEFLNVCEHPAALRTTNAVSGTKEYYSCEYMRSRGFKCGYETPRYYVPKPPGLLTRIAKYLWK